jgi:hypothetical protein
MERSKACLKKLRQLNALPSQTWCGYISQITTINNQGRKYTTKYGK